MVAQVDCKYAPGPSLAGMHTQYSNPEWLARTGLVNGFITLTAFVVWRSDWHASLWPRQGIGCAGLSKAQLGCQPASHPGANVSARSSILRQKVRQLRPCLQAYPASLADQHEGSYSALAGVLHGQACSGRLTRADRGQQEPEIVPLLAAHRSEAHPARRPTYSAPLCLALLHPCRPTATSIRLRTFPSE